MNRLHWVSGFLFLVLVTSCLLGQTPQRVVLAEDFTGTGCVNCPKVGHGLENLFNAREASKDNDFFIIAYHKWQGDPFQIDAGKKRAVFYSVGSLPTVCFDGKLYDATQLGSYDYTAYFQEKKAIPPQADIQLTTDVNAFSMKVKNITGGSLSGKVHVVMVERHIPYSWMTEKECDFTCRAMYPGDGTGLDVTLAAGADTTIDGTFSIGSTWNRDNIYFVAFYQTTGPNKEIFQTAFKKYGVAEGPDGDVNQDGVKNDLDLQLLGNHLAENTTLSAEQLAHVDWNPTGSIDLTDHYRLGAKINGITIP